MKLDPKLIRFVTHDQFRVLVAIEMGMRNHEYVPTPLIRKISGLRSGGFSGILSALAKMKCIHHDSKFFDGYNLTYLGYDYLSLKTFGKRNILEGIGRQIGVGKESDVYLVALNREGILERIKEGNTNPNNTDRISQNLQNLEEIPSEGVLKLERLGRTSFTKVKRKRDYLKDRSCGNWLYLSRLGAEREFSLMEALYRNDFPVPIPINCNRHCILMSLCKGILLNNVLEFENQERDGMTLLNGCLDLCVKFAEYGMVHCDFNEFNILIDEETHKIWVIDFPQMISVTHENAQELFNRDYDCITTFFRRRFGIINEERNTPPLLKDIKIIKNLDVEVKASGFDIEKERKFKKLRKQLLLKEEEEQQKEQEDDEEDDEEEGEEGEESEEEDESEEKLKKEDFKIRKRIKRSLERQKVRKKVYKEAKKKARKGKNKRKYWDLKN